MADKWINFFVLFLLIFCLFFPTKVLSTTYFVRDPDSTSSSDGNAGTSPGAAWATVKNAVNTVTGGDTVFIGAGTYNEVDTLNKSWSSYVYFIGDLDGDTCGEVGWPEVGRMVAYGFDCEKVWLQNLYLNTYGSNTFSNVSLALGWSGDADNQRVVLDGCRIAGGFVSTSAQFVAIRNCHFEDDPAITGVRGWYGVIRVAAVDTVFIDNSLIEFNNSGWAGIEFSIYLDVLAVTKWWVRNCIFTGSTGDTPEGYIGYLNAAPQELDYQIYDNDYTTYLNCSKIGSGCTNVGGGWYCCNSLATWQSRCGCDANSFDIEASDSLDADGYHLLGDFATAIDGGKDISASIGVYAGVDYDIDDPQDNRPQGVGFDIGCDEYAEEWVDSLIQTLWHIDTTSSSFKVRDSVYTLYSATADSVTLWVSTSNDLSTALRKDVFTVDNVDTLEASGLTGDTKHYFWCKAWDNNVSDYADTTDVDSIVTLVFIADTIELTVTKEDSANASIVLVYEVFTNIDPPSDSVVLCMSAFDDISTCINKGLVLNDDSSTIAVIRLQQNYKYYFWVIAWATDSSDTVKDSITTLAGSTSLNVVRLRPEVSVSANFGADWEDAGGGSAAEEDIDEQTTDTTDYWKELFVDSTDAFNVDSLIETAFPETVVAQYVVKSHQCEKGMIVIGRSELRTGEYNNYPSETLWVSDEKWDTLFTRLRFNPADDSLFQQIDFLEHTIKGWFIRIYRECDPTVMDTSIYDADAIDYLPIVNNFYAMFLTSDYNGELDSIAFKMNDNNYSGHKVKLALFTNKTCEGSNVCPDDMVDSTAETNVTVDGWVKAELVNGVKIASGTNYWVVLRQSVPDTIRLYSGGSVFAKYFRWGGLAYTDPWVTTDIDIELDDGLVQRRASVMIWGWDEHWIRLANAWVDVQYQELTVGGGIMIDNDQRSILGGGIIK